MQHHSSNSPTHNCHHKVVQSLSLVLSPQRKEFDCIFYLSVGGARAEKFAFLSNSTFCVYSSYQYFPNYYSFGWSNSVKHHIV